MTDSIQNELAIRLKFLREDICNNCLELGTVSVNGHDYSIIKYRGRSPLWPAENEELMRLAKIGVYAESEMKAQIGRDIVTAAYREGISFAFEMLRKHLNFDLLEKILLGATDTTPDNIGKGAEA